MQQTSSSQSEEQESTVTHVSVTATSGENSEESNIPNIRIISTDEPQRGSTEATESSASEGISLLNQIH